MVLQLRIPPTAQSLSWIEYAFAEHFKLPKKKIIRYEEAIEVLGSVLVRKAVMSGTLNCIVVLPTEEKFLHQDEVVRLVKEHALHLLEKVKEQYNIND